MRLLVVEADPALAEFLNARFQQERFSVEMISDAQHLARFPDDTSFDLALLDSNLPGQPGGEAFRSMRCLWPGMPVILLSSDATVEERIRGLNAGADDVLVKPFNVAELIARIRAVVRRRNGPIQNAFVLEGLEVNRVSHEVKRAGRAIELSPKEYALLDCLLRNPGGPVSRKRIIEEVWRMHGDSNTNVVDVYVNYLRRKIDAGAERALIRTVRGVGYQLGGEHREV